MQQREEITRIIKPETDRTLSLAKDEVALIAA